MPKILIAGCGYVGAALGARLVAAGHEVWGLSRDPARLPAGVRPLAADLTEAQTLRALPPALDTVFYTAGSAGYSEAAYRAIYVDGVRHLLHALDEQGHAPRLFFTSSTGVYGQSDGEWVDEDSPTAPGSFSGQLLLEGEQLFLGSPFPATILRLGGIYGPGRTSLIDKVRAGEASCAAGRPRHTNRIHRDDAAGALHHLMGLAQPAALYLGVDDEPAARCTVYRWLAARLGVPAPPTIAEPARRRGGNKRCRNARLRATGYPFRYPTFREGYAALLEQTNDAL